MSWEYAAQVEYKIPSFKKQPKEGLSEAGVDGEEQWLVHHVEPVDN